MKYSKIAAGLCSAAVLFASQAFAYQSTLYKPVPTCQADETLVWDTYTFSSIHGFGGLGDNIVTNVAWANFSIDQSKAQNIRNFFVQVVFANKTQYDEHNIYVVPTGSNVQNICWKLGVQGYDWILFDNLDSSIYADQIKRTGKTTLGISHIDPHGEFKEYL
ncbi:hypothetical protein P4S72_27680 [Vibrio sp. PP-XX7]